MTQEIQPPEPPQIPHQAIISINAVINQQMPDGSWHPRSTFSDQFYLRLTGNSEKEVKDSLIKQLGELKAKWNGQIGRLATNSDMNSNQPPLTTEDTQLLNAQIVDPNSATSGLSDPP